MPILFTPGQVVPVADFTALGQQHGGDKSQQARPPTAAEEAAAKAAARDAAPLGDDEVPDPQDPRTWYIKYETNPIHRYHFADGSYVEARTAPNGTDYQIVEYHPSATFTQAETKRAAADTAGSAEWHTEGTPDGQGGFDNTKPIMVRTVNGVKQYRQPDDKELRSWQNTQQMSRNPGGKTDAEIAAEADKNKPTIAAAAAGRPAVQYVPDPDNPGQVKAVPIPGAPEAPAAPEQQLSAPSDQMWIVVQKPGQPPTFVKNKNYVKPSRIMPDPGDPTKLVNITHDDNGNVISVPVTGTTVIKPADLPVLQAKYGQIAQGLGALAQDLNSRYARGEITEKQKNDAFTAAHQQASTQVSEINSILETSKSIWSGELTQRGQSLQETQSRRSFAESLANRAMQTGIAVGESAGPGHGKAIAAGVGAMMRMGQRYAEGMGGFRESPEIALPAALQQARGIGLPGFGEAAPGAPPGPPGAAPGPGMGPPPGGLPAPLLRPPPPVTGSVAAPGGLDPGFSQSPPGGSGLQDPGFSRDPAAIPGMPTDPGFTRGLPGVGGMGAALQGAQGFGGSPVAAGGLGVYDPSQDMQGMLGDGADPTWAEAVRRAAGEATQPGFAWQRFGQPASRFG